MTDGDIRKPSKRVRIERAMPAPLMDGYDVRALKVGRTYRLEEGMARYLIAAGYAVEPDGDAANVRRQHKGRS
jgi:hypothetical protein